MKKAGSLFTLLILVLACQSEQEDPAVSVQSAVPGKEKEETVFYGTTESRAESKAYVDENRQVLWNADDRVSIFAKQDVNQEYHFTGADGAKAGEFTKVSQEAAGTGNTLPYNYAIYPYSSGTAISTEGVLSVVLPAEQTYKEDSFGPGANMMVAVSEDNQLHFKNVGTYVSINLYGSNVAVKQITFRGNNGEKLAGAASIQMIEGLPALTMASENVSETVTLVCPDVTVGVDSEHAAAFWFVLPPTKFTKGFTVTVEDSAGHLYVKSTANSVDFSGKRSIVTRMVAFECAVLGFGLYPVSGEAYVYDPATDQMNIYEAEGQGWFRYLVPELEVWLLGPIPLDVAEGATIENVTLTVSTAGVQNSSKTYETLTVRSFQNGTMTLASEAGDQFVIRF